MIKKILSSLLAAALVIGTLPAALAASDINGHWAQTYIEAMHNDGVINPAADGSYSPNATITRAEFMRYVNRAFGFTEKSPISFTDVPTTLADGTTPWYYETVQIATHYGYINGVGNNRMNPDGTITREQASTIIGRLQKYEPKNTTAALPFSDKASIASWSGNYIAEAVANGYLNGYTNGTFKPTGSITRAEIAKLLYFYIGTRLSTTNTDYTASTLQSDTKNVTITTACTLSDCAVPGNLYITEGVGSGTVILNNVTVKGEIIVSGGAEVILNNVTAANLIESTPLTMAQRIVCTGTTSIGSTEVQDTVALVEQELSASAGGISDLVVNGDGITVTLDATVWDLTVKQPATIVTSGSTTISNMAADAKVNVSGGGNVSHASFAVTGSSLSMKPTSYELASGVTAVLAGETVSSSNSVVVSPASLTYDRAAASKLETSYAFNFSGNSEALYKVTNGSHTLTENSDYSVSGTTLTLYRTYLTALGAGVHTIKLSFDDGTSGVITLHVTDSSVSAITPSTATYDKNTSSAEHGDVAYVLNLASGVTLSEVKVAGVVVERGTAYTYAASSGTVKLLSSWLEKKAVGSMTVTFVLSDGTLYSTLSITDSSPVNTVSPAAIDFDANSKSGGYTDREVTLTPIDGATLSYIRAGSTRLEEDWQYRVSGSTITLNRSALSTLGEKGANYVDLTFVMSTGTSPTLRVNYVTTYPLQIIVADDLDEGVAGTSVTVTPTDAEVGTAAQTVTTDAEGNVTVYVKKAEYTITAANAKFSASVSEKVSMNGSKSVKLTAQIVEDVTITVTDAYGAKISGATVTLGGKNITTGADGTATFTLSRGGYTLQISASGYTPVTQPLTVGDTVNRRIILEEK